MHKHAKPMNEYNERIQNGEMPVDINKDLLCNGGVCGGHCFPAWFEENEYTWRPKTMTVTIPELCYDLDYTGEIYMLCSFHVCGYIHWSKGEAGSNTARNGYYKTEEDVIAAVKALRGEV